MPSHPSSAGPLVYLLVVRLAPTVGERVTLFSGAALTPGEVTDCLHERALLIREREQRRRGGAGGGGHSRHRISLVRMVPFAYHMSEALFPTDAELEQILVGPESITWQVTSDARLYAVMLYPLLLQVAHPTVGAGVSDYSDFERRPWDRLLRTIDYVSLLVYGGREAIAAGRRLRSLHKGFKGTRADGQPYYALEPEAYAWVHATLIDTYVKGHAHFGAQLSAAEIERFYAEYRGLGRLIGVRERDLPATWAGFQSYFAEMLRGGLSHTTAVDQVLGAIRHAPPPPVPVPDVLWRAMRVGASQLLWLGGIGLIEPELRRRLGVQWSGQEELQFRTLGLVSRSLSRVMPESLKVMGPATLRWRRRAIVRGPLGPTAELAT